MNITIKKVAELLNAGDCFCFLCHKGLDGDTTGAAYAFFYALKQLGKKSIVKTFENEYLEKFSYIFSEREEDYEEFEVEHFITIDVADFGLLEEKYKHREISLAIDHHQSNTVVAKFKYVDETAAATCEIVYEILKELPVRITRQIANCLYTGLVTDTGCFKYDNVTAKTHRIAADLIEYGADYSKINFNMFGKKSVVRLNLEKEIIEHLEYFYEGLCVIVFLTNDMIKKTRATKEDYSDIAYIASFVETAVFAITAKEEENGFKISVRTKKDYDASLFCKKFKGGGHKKAAGCFIEGSKETIKLKLLDELKNELKNLRRR